MRGNQRMAKNSYSLTGVTWSFMFMIVFCFAGCAAGSCLSYGHSCWGAHGKRSGISGSSNLRPLSIRELNEESNRNIVSPSPKDHWMLSRLITKRHQIPKSGKYRIKLYDVWKGKEMPNDWDDSIASDEENDIFRDHADKFLKNKENKEESEESEGFLHEVPENFAEDENAEIIFLPRRGDTSDNSRQLRFIKISTNTDDNLK